ncbi:NAD(P)/FAD-dependent oxidoreductase, partial [candidate division KSB1 bacterium]|nr:NAD(P)/FAD-dependent oxidoreductase [candidate division KSB1 bacterium]
MGWERALVFKESYDVIVVGGGPAGLLAARTAAEGGVSVLLLEKDREIGVPVRCAEGVGVKGLKEFMEPDDRWIANRIDGVRFIAPDGTVVPVYSQELGYILNRKVFDYELARQAAARGVRILTKAFVNGLIRENGWVKGVTVLYDGREQMIGAQVVIGADGVESRAGRWAGLRTMTTPRNMEICAQMTLAHSAIDQRFCDFFFGKKVAPGGYVWIFPKGERLANVGIGIRGDYVKNRSPLSYLNEFVEKRFPGAAILTMVAGGVPIDKPVKRMVTNGFMLAGDAAHQSNPMSGGGIINAMEAGRLAGQVAARAIREENVSQKRLEEYELEWDELSGKDHRRFYRLKE